MCSFCSTLHARAKRHTLASRSYAYGPSRASRLGASQTCIAAYAFRRSLGNLRFRFTRRVLPLDPLIPVCSFASAANTITAYKAGHDPSSFQDTSPQYSMAASQITTWLVTGYVQPISLILKSPRIEAAHIRHKYTGLLEALALSSYDSSLLPRRTSSSPPRATPRQLPS